MAVVSTETTKRELSPTEKEIQRLQAEFNAKKAQIRATGIRADLQKGLKNNPNMTDAELYTLTKPFDNYHERRLAKEREASGQPKATRRKKSPAQ